MNTKWNDSCIFSRSFLAFVWQLVGVSSPQFENRLKTSDCHFSFSSFLELCTVSTNLILPVLCGKCGLMEKRNY